MKKNIMKGERQSQKGKGERYRLQSESPGQTNFDLSLDKNNNGKVKSVMLYWFYKRNISPETW